ncbi:4'-phosphopantetheinyl transferase superfamily protein [Flavobacterium tructae]|jgi:4'-phosphopantetheinyl transferase|uniref:4'-phosphopantetheinyl transferase family protein n=1 Tax=Flavobacterium TaxID=237 RepID=UPI00201EC0B0|nr:MULTISPECIES: 4'-phosphopantetheinyl transferase superfamily protein [Flavobacterium]MDL2141601.1 4'-phosphopantetheinyl transferase superfamily protein [Flavobacterium tructae]URC14793.1 4'-phosphopantetheinyl transferase superfamily protein [Flavobacterium sp. B183]
MMQNSTHYLAFNDFESIPKIDLKEDEYYLFQYSSDSNLDQGILKYYLEFLPQKFRQEVLKYRRWDDRYNCLFGKLMVCMGSHILGNNTFEFDKIVKDIYGKPYMLDSSFNFNISHSGNTVVCVFSKQQIGVDIEEINEINYSLFENVFSTQEFAEINRDGLDKFYEFWTRKESVIKAIGKGMSIPLTEIEINKGYVTYGEDTWYTKSFKIDNKFCSITTKYDQIKSRQTHILF